MSLVDCALSLGGELVQSVDLRTGEIYVRAREDGRNAGSEYRPNRNGARGLSPCHISPKIEYRAGASVLTAKRAKSENKSKQDADERKETKRGKISGFSAKSRNRLMRLLASVRRDRLPLFVTLTYPREFPDIRQAKRDLDALIKRLARRFPAVAGVWKLEPQERGAPHFHLLIWGVSYRDLFAFLPFAWHEIAGGGDENHLKWHLGELGNRPCVQRIEKQGGVFWYASKYMSKEVGTYEWGRWWGVFFRERLPFGELVHVEVTEEKAIEFIRYMRRYARVRSRDYRSLTVICFADFWVNRLL